MRYNALSSRLAKESTVYLTHIRRRFAMPEDSGAEFDRIVSAYWSTNAAEFIAAKLRDKELYSSQLRQKFAAEVDDLGK
jgi:hypothetical protein